MDRLANPPAELTGALPAEEALAVALRPETDVDAWRRTVDLGPAADPRFELRVFEPEDFEQVWDLIDAAFGTRRPRRLFEWLYRENPNGPAFCCGMTERGGALVATTSVLPWPIARGASMVFGWLGADAATHPDWQRRAVRRHLVGAVEAWNAREPGYHEIGWPNIKTASLIRKWGDGRRILGSPTKLQLRLPSGRAGASRRAGPGGLFKRRTVVVEPVARFDGGFDRVTRRAMAWRGWWSPHDAAFLSWRYLDHPTREYHARVALVDDQPAGYCVVSVAGDKAVLVELAAETDADPIRGALLRSAIELAREAGCPTLTSRMTPGWRHEAFLRRAGFRAVGSDSSLMISPLSPDEAFDLRVWQLVAGDNDAW